MGRNYVAVTPTEKYNDAYCDKCSHYWLRGNSETCTNPKVKSYHGKKKKINSMCVCDYYDPCDE